MPSNTCLSQNAKAILSTVREELAAKRPAGSREPTDSDAVLELARRAGKL